MSAGFIQFGTWVKPTVFAPLRHEIYYPNLQGVKSSDFWIVFGVNKVSQNPCRNLSKFVASI